MDSANSLTMIKYGYRKGGTLITIYLFLILSLLLFSFCSQNDKNELSPKIKNVEPSNIWNGKENVISIFGENFIQGIKYNFSEDKAEKIIFRVFLEGEDQSFDLPFLCESEKFCKAYIKEGMPPGLYKLVVINYYGLRGDYPIRVIKFLPPVITSVSRENISNASEQEVFVFGEYFDEITGVFLNENKVNFYTVSSTEISFIVPRGFPKGSYTLKVFNSEGSSGETKINVFDGASIKLRVLYPENIFKNSSFPVDFEVKNVGGLKADLNLTIIFGGKEISTGEISLSPEESKKLSYSVPITEVQEIFLNIKGKDIYGGEVEASLKEVVYAKCSEEVCDGKDNDCDGIVDNGVLLVFMKDKDNDGYSDGVSQLACTPPSPNFKPVNEILGYDCNDDDPEIYSGKPEICDYKDNDCNGLVDDGVRILFWEDNDRDGYGDKNSDPVEACFPPTSKHVPNNLDCDDSAKNIYPGAPIVCGNFVDEDCDGNIEILLWEDRDGDSYTTDQVCANTLAEGLTSVSRPYDCNDLDPLAYPGAYERLNNQDDDCDGIPDDNLSPIAEVFFTSATSIGIRWEDRTQDEEKFVIEYSDRPDFSSFSVAEVPQNVTQVYIQPLSPETTYFFRVYAQNSFARTSPSQLMATTSKKEGKSFVASGSYHTCAIKEDYSLWCWGENSSGQLGIPELYGQTATEPHFVMNDVHFVSVNEANTCAIKKDGTLWCWGNNSVGQIGDGSFGSDVSQPTFVMDQVLKVSVGYDHTCAIKSDGSLWCWGNNQYGQVGDGTMGTIKPFPVQPIGMSRDVLDVSAGSDHTCAVKNDSSLWCWGVNDRGQLGDGTSVGKVIPKRIFASGVKKVSTGNKYTCAIKNDSSLWCWGKNSSGQLGLGIIGGYYTIPQPVTNDVIKVSTSIGWSWGYAHTCAVKSDGSIFCWGNNSYGQLGNGSFGNNISSPSSDIYVDAFYNRLTDIYHVSAGNSHTCAVDNSNQIWCWGNNYYGQLGIGKDSNYYETYYRFPRQVTSVGKVKGVSGGYSSTCVIKEDNSLWCWGGNDSGQLGDGTFINRAFPHMKITDNVLQISANHYHTCAIISDNSLWCWGRNLYGQLGLGFSGGNINTPQKVMEDVASVSVGENHTCSMKQDNSPLCWGDNELGQIGDGTNIQRLSPYPVKISDIVISVSSGYSHTCALMSDRSLWCWGYNGYGQIGSGSSTSYCVVGYYCKNPTKIMDDVVQFSAGGYHTCAVKQDGSLWCWGDNSYGQLGDGTNTNRNTPVPITPGVSSVALGSDHTCAVKTDGSLWCWGRNNYGQLGDGTSGFGANRNAPVQITSSGVSSVALGGYHTCAVKTDGSLWCWGNNYYGQLGDGTGGFGVNRNTPVQIMSSGVSSVALGRYHTCAVKQDGSLWCWGDNSYGQLGDGTNTNRNTPVPITPGVSSVALGSDHTCAVKQDGSLWCWGDNSYGQLGDGTSVQKTTPYPVITPAGALSISVGRNHSCAIKTDGSLWCWGNNSSGQLGNGQSVWDESGGGGSYFPSQVLPPMLSDVSFVSLGGDHSCAVKIDGSLWCWGRNNYGQLGDGTYTNRNTPFQIMSSGVSSVALGLYHTCAIKQDGSLWCWGANYYGQLGDGTYTNRNTPFQIMSSGVSSVALGLYHTCAVKTDGSLWCWGANYYGQVDGNGTFDTNEAFARKVTFSYSSPAPRLNFIYKDNNNKLSGLSDTNEFSQPYSCLSFGVRAFDLVLIMVVIYFFAKRRSLLKLVNLKTERKIRIKERR